MPYPVQMPGMDSLMNTFGSYNPATYQMAQQTFDLSKAYNEQNLVDQRMATDQQAKMNPLLVDEKALSNETTRLNNTSTGIKNENSQRDLDVRKGVPMSDEIKAATSKLASQVSDEQMKMLGNKVQEMALSSDPNVRKQGLAMMQNFRSLVEEREKIRAHTAGQLQVVGAQGANARALEQQQFEHGKYNKSGQVRDILTKLQTEGDPIKRDALIRGLYAQGQASQDDSMQATAQYLLQQNLPAYNNAIAVKAGANAGKPAMEPLGIEPIPVPQGGGFATPGGAPAAAAPSGVPKAGEVRKGYRFKGGNPADKNNWEKV